MMSKENKTNYFSVNKVLKLRAEPLVPPEVLI